VIRLKKTGSGYDGDYQVTYSLILNVTTNTLLIALAGNVPVEIISSTTGVFQVQVIPYSNANGPVGVFLASKNNASITGSILKWSGNPGIGSSESLRMTWESGAGLKIYKTSTDTTYDGTYYVKWT
jgi:hypothetical protein